jgi:hypothetical protein
MNAEKREGESATRAAPCRCGASYDAFAFGQLDVVRVLGAEEIAPLVVRWPHGVAVDVRACASCTAPIARLSRGR